MTIDKIQEIITTVIASAGGIGGIIAVLTAIIKVFGGNSVKAKLAAMKVELDKTMESGLTGINDGIVGRVNTDISVDIGAKVDEAITAQLAQQKIVNERILEENGLILAALSEVLTSQSEMRVLSEETRKRLAEKGVEVAAVKPIEREIKPVAHITLAPQPEAEQTTQEPKTDKTRAIKAVL